MKVYFFGSKIEDKISLRYLKVLEVLKKSGISVACNLNIDKVAEFTSQDLEKINQSGEILLDKMDGLIIEGSVSNPEIGYLVAFAISRKKPVLFLIEKGKVLDPTLRNIYNDRSTAKFLKLQHYTINSLEKYILYFLRTIEGLEENVVPTIKFTLRITPMIERYLTWKTKDAKQTKAQFLRNKIIKEIIKKDNDYQKYLGKK